MARRPRFVVMAMAVCVAGILLAPSWLATSLTVLAFGFLPGAVISDLVLGRVRDLAAFAAMSIGLSLACGVLVAVLLGATVGLTHTSVAYTLALVTVLLAAAVGWLLSGRDVAAANQSVTAIFNRRVWRSVGALVVLVVVGAAVGWSISYARSPLHARGVAGYTVLWIVPKGDRFVLGVKSQELRPARYRLIIDDGAGHDIRRGIKLAPGGRWRVSLGASSRSAKVSATLYLRQSGRWVPYRHVRAVVS